MRALALLLLAVAAPAAAQVRIVPEQPASASSARGGVDVFLINDSDAEAPAAPPAELEVTARDAARLALVPAEQGPATIAPRGFARVRYLPAGVVAIAQPAPLPRTGLEVSAAPVGAGRREPSDEPLAGETIVNGGAGESAGFLDRFAPYEPIYGAAGLNDSGAKLQVSFALKPFGGDGALSHFTFAYTQTMFWAIDRPSGPFRATTYSPEAFFDVPVRSADDLHLAFGYRHDSNGEGDPGSIDVNRIFVRVAKGFDLGDGWRLELVPQGWFYVGRRGAAPGIADYWGYAALKASVGRDDGLKLSVTGRGSFETGRGAGELFASYPLGRLGSGIGVYLFGQAFTGFGEALDDYRVNDTHARLGIALTR